MSGARAMRCWRASPWEIPITRPGLDAACHARRFPLPSRLPHSTCTGAFMSVEVKRYHPALITLHWLLAVAILLAVGFGSFVLDGMANDNIHKPGLLRM